MVSKISANFRGKVEKVSPITARGVPNLPHVGKGEGRRGAVHQAVTPVRPSPRRDLRWIAAGLAAICAGGVGGAALYVQATDSQSVVRVNRTVARGETVSAADLSVTTVGSMPGVATVPASEVSKLIGKFARTDLVSGSLLAPGQIGEPTVEPGTTQLGLRLAPGRLPSQPLPVGAHVRLIGLSPATPSPATVHSGGEVSFGAVIVGLPKQLPEGAWVLDVAVAAADGMRVAQLAAADQLALLREADR